MNKKTKKVLTMIVAMVLIFTMPLSVCAKEKRQKHKISMGRFKLTAYCPCERCSEGWGRRTHSGATAQSNYTVAADLSVMNLGDWITIDGKKYKVEDSGGGVVGDHIDIFFDTHEEVEEFGVRYGNVNIWRY